MITALKFRSSPHEDLLPSRASGTEAQRVQADVDEVRHSFAQTQSLAGRAFREFANTFLDARHENWDGYDAAAVHDATFVRAGGFLRQCLNRFPAPAAGATPGGALTFEWMVGPDRRFIVSIDEDEQIAFAGVFGSSTVHGTESFLREVPPEIWKHLSRLFPE